MALLLPAEVGLRFAFPTYDFTHDPLNGGHTTRWESNSQALRGPEPHATDLRVVVYGDSNIMARFSPWDETFTARLETALRNELDSTETHKRAARQVDVVNAGVDGYGPDQSYLKMRTEMASLRPDIIVLDVFADNDFGDLVCCSGSGSSQTIARPLRPGTPTSTSSST